jgi:FHS family L-fucose permease-like MFS transporter
MKNKSLYIPIGVMFLFYFLIQFTTGLNNPFAKVIQTQFSLSTFQSQLGYFYFFITYLFMGIPASIVVRKLGYKKASLFAIAGMIVGFSVVFAGGNLASIWLYLIGVFLLGCAITILQVVVNPLITVLGSKEGANSRMNFGGAIASIGAMLAPLVVGMIIGKVAYENIDKLQIADVNPLLYVILVVLAIMFLALLKVNIPEPDITQANAEKVKGTALQFKHFRWGLVAIFLYVGLEVTTANLTNLYMLNDLGIDAGIAGAVVGTYWLMMFVGRLIGAAVGTKLSSRPQLIIVSLSALSFYIGAILLNPAIKVWMPAVDSQFNVLFAEVPINVLLLVLVGLCTSVMWTCIFILATDGLGKYINQASGIFMMMVFGGAIIPALQGKMVDVFGFLPSYWVGFVCILFIFGYGIFNKRIAK